MYVPTGIIASRFDILREFFEQKVVFEAQAAISEVFSFPGSNHVVEALLISWLGLEPSATRHPSSDQA